MGSGLLQGTLDMLVLKALTWGPRHGYAVARWIRATTEEALQVEEGALYTALHRLERRKYVASEWGLSESNRRAKYYTLTAAGHRELDRHTRAFTEYVDAVFKILRATSMEAVA